MGVPLLREDFAHLPVEIPVRDWIFGDIFLFPFPNSRGKMKGSLVPAQWIWANAFPREDFYPLAEISSSAMDLLPNLPYNNTPL